MELIASEIKDNSTTLFQNFHVFPPDSCSSYGRKNMSSLCDNMEKISSPCNSEAHLPSPFDSIENISSPSNSKEHIPLLYYQNPVLKGSADPDVLYYEGTYYMYATSSTLPVGYEVYTSKDLVNWEYGGIVMGEVWGMKRWYWAPDIMERNGKFYLLVSVNEHLGIATANSPLGPFIPEPHYLFDKSIDGHYFIDEDGVVYIFYVSWRPGKTYALYGLRMEADCVTPILSTETLVISAAEEWETQKAPVAEAPYVIKHKGKYYLTYSGSHFESSSYAVGYATADSPLGPYKKYEGNPILSKHYKSHGPGHHCIVNSPDGQEMFILYHIHHDTDTVSPRNICVDRIRFIPQKDTEDRLEVYGPSVIPKPYPLGNNQNS
jgi:beta-xylosidase